MSFNFGAPNPAGVTVNQPFSKDVRVSAAKLTFADFTTGGAARVVLALPADASIVRMSLWVKTQLAGGSVSAATISVGTPASATAFVNAVTAFGAAGTYTVLTPITGIMQDYNIPWGLDTQLQITGTATTGNPTSGEIYLVVDWIR